METKGREAMRCPRCDGSGVLWHLEYTLKERPHDSLYKELTLEQANNFFLDDWPDYDWAEVDNEKCDVCDGVGYLVKSSKSPLEIWTRVKIVPTSDRQPNGKEVDKWGEVLWFDSKHRTWVKTTCVFEDECEPEEFERINKRYTHWVSLNDIPLP